MNLRKILTILFVTSSLLGYSRDKISIDRIYSTKQINLQMPVLIDSINLKGNKFANKDLFEALPAIPPKESFSEELRADVMQSYFFFSKPQKSAQIRLLTFQLTADRYCKAKIKVTSPSLFQVYIADKKELTKESIEDSLNLAKFQEKEFTMIPGTIDFTIKYLSFASNKAPEGVKISIEPDKEDSITNFKISYGNKRLIRTEDLTEGTRITNSSISPDGQFVLLDLKTVGSDGKSISYTELLDTKTNKKTYLGTQTVKWMPKSNLYYYTVLRAEKTELITVNPKTFEENRLAENIPTTDFYFSPDEKTLLISEKESFDERKGDLKLLASPEDRQEGYYDRYFIHKYDLATGVKTRLTYGKRSTIINDISSDSRYLLYSVRETTTNYPFYKTSIFRLDMENLAVDSLFINEGFASQAVFSLDGKKILISGTPNAFDNIGLNVDPDQIPNGYDTQAFIMDLPSKKIEAITKDFDPSIDYLYWNWADNMIYLKVDEKDCMRMYRYNPNNKVFTSLNLPEDVVKKFSLASNATMASYFGLSASNSTKAYIVNLKTDKATLICDPLKKMFEDLSLGEVKDWNFTSSDGTTIAGRYYLPPNFDASKKYPMIVYYYGGASPTVKSFDFPYSMHVYASQGYVVYVVQPSGTTGFGQKFSARHVNAWGKRTAEDIIEGTRQFVNEHSFVDSTKIGCMGASYGGFMTMYLQTQTNLFAAAVSHAGISSLSSYWGEGYWGYTYSSRASTGSYPWNNKDLYVNQSPLFSADKIKTPLLLLHGTADTNVPIGQSIQMYTALKILGSPVEFIQVKGENHGIQNYKKRLEWSKSMYAWFAKWLKNDSAWWDSLYPAEK